MDNAETYKPVPVAAAESIAREYDKAIVVIIAWDAAHNRLHTTTYAPDAQYKAGAAELGEILAQASGANLDQVTNYEDFRTCTQAEWAEEKSKLVRCIEALQRAATAAGHAIASVRAVREGISDETLDEVKALIDHSIEQAKGVR